MIFSSPISLPRSLSGVVHPQGGWQHSPILEEEESPCSEELEEEEEEIGEGEVGAEVSAFSFLLFLCRMCFALSSAMSACLDLVHLRAM